MNQQRIQSYINLIQKLLACPSGEEWILLRQNEGLVTPELVQVMEQLATQLDNQGNLKEATFLHNLGGQIHHLFMAQTVQTPHEDDKAQIYLELIKALLECPQGSEAELLAAHQELIGPGLVHRMQQVAAQLVANGNPETAQYLQHWAREINHLWVQQHNFQPMAKKDPEPKHLVSLPVNEVPSPFSSVTPQPSSSGLAEEEEDVWAELSGDPQAKPYPRPTPQPTPQPAPAVPVKPAPIQDEDLWAELSGDLQPKPPPPAATVPLPPDPLPPAPIQDLAPESRLDRVSADQINRHLETIAGALTRLSETLTPPPPPTNPLWYMEVLEQAHAGNWVLTTAEIHQLIGVKPTCPQGSESFQRGCWVFVKAGKLGTQMSWRVKKENELTEVNAISTQLASDSTGDQPC